MLLDCCEGDLILTGAGNLELSFPFREADFAGDERAIREGEALEDVGVLLPSAPLSTSIHNVS